VKDSAQAVAWTLRSLRELGGDPQRVFVMGHSAGAYNASMVALDPRWLREAGASPDALRGWIGLAGPYDFLPIENEDVKPVFFAPDSPPDSQPVRHVQAGAPPALLIASHKDKLVSAERNTAGLAKRCARNRCRWWSATSTTPRMPRWWAACRGRCVSSRRLSKK
jgi:acetyl esterase/lipase